MAPPVHNQRQQTPTLPLVRCSNGFSLLPVAAGSSGVAGIPSMSTHYLYLKKHSTLPGAASLVGAEAPAVSQSTLFLANLPADTTIAHLRRIFRRCGRISSFAPKCSSTSFSELLPSGLSAHVVFDDCEAVQKALDMKQRKRVWSDAVDDMSSDIQVDPRQLLGASRKWCFFSLIRASLILPFPSSFPTSKNAEPMLKISLPDSFPLSGYLAHFAKTHPSLNDLSERVAASLQAFDEQKDLLRQSEFAKLNQPDEEGWITVTKAHRRNLNKGLGASVRAVSVEEMERLREQGKLDKGGKGVQAVGGFYRWQLRETKAKRTSSLALFHTLWEANHAPLFRWQNSRSSGSSSKKTSGK